MKVQKITLIVLILMCLSYVFFSNGAHACWTGPGYQNPCGFYCCDDPSCSCTAECKFNWYCVFNFLWDIDCRPADCPCRTALHNDKTKLDVLRATRDLRMARTAFGRTLIKLYYRHSMELTSILLSVGHDSGRPIRYEGAAKREAER